MKAAAAETASASTSEGGGGRRRKKASDHSLQERERGTEMRRKRGGGGWHAAAGMRRRDLDYFSLRRARRRQQNAVWKDERQRDAAARRGRRGRGDGDREKDCCLLPFLLLLFSRSLLLKHCGCTADAATALRLLCMTTRVRHCVTIHDQKSSAPLPDLHHHSSPLPTSLSLSLFLPLTLALLPPCTIWFTRYDLTDHAALRVLLRHSHAGCSRDIQQGTSSDRREGKCESQVRDLL